MKENKGYYFDHQRGKFRVQFTFNGKRYRLGRYETAEIAHNVYLVTLKNLKAEREMREGITND